MIRVSSHDAIPVRDRPRGDAHVRVDRGNFGPGRLPRGDPAAMTTSISKVALITPGSMTNLGWDQQGADGVDGRR